LPGHFRDGSANGKVNGKVNCLNADNADEPDDADRSVCTDNSSWWSDECLKKQQHHDPSRCDELGIPIGRIRVIRSSALSACFTCS
jgi:hypothetical protein